MKKLEELKKPPNRQPEQPLLVMYYYQAAFELPRIFPNHKNIRRSPFDGHVEENPKELDRQFFEIVEDIIKSFGLVMEQFTVKENFIKIHQHLVPFLLLRSTSGRGST
jgi:hypothetical protein